ncbi:MAG: DNA replication protein [Alphaproteobacteria bacterium]|nr:DNA replication protein [Alphaproteobacteria bacterium]
MTGALQLPLDLGHRTAFGDEDFLIAPSNEAAVAWIDRWPDWPGQGLVLCGPAGCGKTHLAHVWQAKSGAPLVEAKALGGVEPREILKEAKACIVEGAGAGCDESALFHLYNVLAERKGHLLLTEREAPARWTIALADLRSRLVALPAVRMGPPDDRLFAAVLVKLFNDRQIGVGEEVIAYLLSRIERSFATARATVEALDQEALARRRRVTVPFVREVLGGEN